MPAKNPDAKTARKAAPRKRAAKPKSSEAVPVDLDVQQQPEHGVLSLDFPSEGEPIASREYTLRMTAADGVPAVEVSVDEGPWETARPAVGHWWYDWTGFAPGEHAIRVRAIGPDGQQVLVQRICRVDAQPDLNA